MAVIAPYGSWASPITAELLVEKAVQLSGVQVDGDTVYWVEGRPAEGGRQALVRRLPDGSTEDVLPPDGNARTLVHEYGGRSYAVRDGVVVFASFADQRLWRLDPGASEPVALTAEPPTPRGVRFGDLELTPDGRFVLAVRERHLGSSATDVVNDVVAVPIGGGEPVVLAEGHDFYAAPRIAPAGDRICWLSWDHPNMPWDGTELFTAPFQDGARHGEPTHLAGGPEESVSRPRWSPEGRLHFASDRSGWWNLYREGDDQPLHRADAEFSGPDWWLGASSYAFLPDGRVVAAYAEGGRTRLAVLDGQGLQPVAIAWTSLGNVQPCAAGIVAIAASPTDPDAVVRVAVPDGAIDVLRASRTLSVDPSWISVAEPITFATEDGLEAHAFWYPPVNPDHAAPAGELPPLMVMSHGGPTGNTPTTLDLELQFWTSRGFAVVDVDYGGSSGYGRAYRERLKDRWGIVDVDDCVNAARWLAEQGRVDGDRMVIRGGSAGGWTTLAALTFRDTFAAGASYFGVADAEALALDTHKFESRYLDGLIGPYPQARDVYRERSPIHHTDQLSTPMILFQGLEDMVVPAAQSEMMAEALRAKGVPFAYLAYEGEQHGFRKAETIIRSAQAELAFYGRVLGFTPAGDLPPIPLENADALA